MGISTSSLGKVRYNVRGVYNTSDSYTVDDIVNYGGGHIFANKIILVEVIFLDKMEVLGGKKYLV